ncbi:MAG: hypothetical protein LBE91_00490 [Tannerella sp.]|jgi:hypothetical protein|nr:hypothetical protein [Tannerella sp.]
MGGIKDKNLVYCWRVIRLPPCRLYGVSGLNVRPNDRTLPDADTGVPKRRVFIFDKTLFKVLKTKINDFF